MFTLFKKEKGSSLVPMAIVVGLIALVSISSLSIFGQKSSQIFNTLENKIDFAMQEKKEPVIIVPENEAPVLTAYSPVNAAYGSSYSYSFTATDPENDILSWSWSGTTPPGLTLNSENGSVTGIPTLEGLYNFQITVSDGVNTISETVSLNVQGCASGPIGSVCSDGAIYTGDLYGNRIYILPGGGTRTWASAINNCTSRGGRLPSLLESDRIFNNRLTTGISLNYNYFYWTGEEWNASNAYTYVKNRGTAFAKTDSRPYICVRS